MNILINKNKVVIAEYTDHIENVSYTYPIQKDSVTFFLNNGINKTIIVSETLVNGVQMTSDNIDELLSDLFFLEIEIEDVKGLPQKIEAIEKNKADLVDGYVPAYQLPSYVDDVIEGEIINDTEFDVEGFIIVPERGKIYIDITTNLTYRWSGSIYAEISKSIALGDTEYMAFRGDHGLVAYEHSQQVSGNPHKVTKSEVGLSNVDNTSDTNKPLSTAQADAIKKAVDDIQIGGVNVLRNTNFESSARQRKFIFPSLEWFNAHLGQSVALSCYIKTDDVILSGSKKILLEFALVHEDGTSTYMSLSKTIADNTTFEGRISKIQNLPTKKITEIKYDGVYILDSITSGTAIVGYPQMELGTKATDWNLSIQDAVVDSINILLDTSWKSYWTRVNTDSGTNSVVNNELVFVTSTTSLDSFTRNLNASVVESELIDKQLCTISFDIKSDTANSSCKFKISADYVTPTLIVNADWTRYSLTFYYQKDKNFAMYFSDMSLSRKFYVRNIKLNRGYLQTAWSVNPQDLETRITALSNRLTALGG